MLNTRNTSEPKTSRARNIENRTLRESELYTKQCDRIVGTYYRADEPLRGLTDTISRSPKVFATMPGDEQYRLAKSDSFARPGGVIARLRIIFQILDEDKVLLAAISVEEDEPYEGF